MTLQFDPSAYAAIYEKGQENELANKRRPFEILQQMGITSGQLADTLQKARQERMLDTPIEKLLGGTPPMNSQNRLSDPVSNPAPTSSASPQWTKEADAGVSDVTPMPNMSTPTLQNPNIAIPKVGMIERFRNFQNGKLPSTQTPTSPMPGLGLPPEVGRLTLKQLQTLGTAKELFAKSNPQDFDYVGITSEGKPVTLNKKTGGYMVGDLPMGTKMQPKTGMGMGPTTGMVSWDTATEPQKRMAIAMVQGNIRAGDLGMRDRATIVTLANEYANQQGTPFQSYRGDVNAGSEKYFAFGKGGQNATSLNTALGHLGDAMTAYSNMQNTNMAFLNKPLNWLRENTNDPDVVSLGINLNALQGELANVFKNSGGTDQEIAKWGTYLNENLTPSQYMAAAEKIDELLRSRLNALNYQQDTSLVGGRRRELLSPKGATTMKTIEKMGGGAGRLNPNMSTSGYVTIRASDGSIHKLPEKNLDAAKQRDPGLQVMQ